MTEDLGTLRWFGEDWGAPVCDPRAQVPVPVGAICQGHDHLHEHFPAVIEPGDQGVTMPSYARRTDRAETAAYHLTCWLHEIGADRITTTERNT